MPTGGKSLNDTLLTGPTLTAKLHNILLTFREGKYAVTADISKIFHRVQVDERNQDYLKVLWINRDQSQLRTFRFRVVLFGATCLPYLLQEIIQMHLKENILGNHFVEKFYVDNYLNTYDRECDPINDKAKLKDLMLDTNTPLQEWVSNSEPFNLLYRLDVSITQNILGVSWELRADTLHITPGDKLMNAATGKFMKRKVLVLISSLFDPLGWLSPLSIRGRIFLQTLWKNKVGWDQELPEQLVSEISEVLCEFQRVSEFSFPHRIVFHSVELHVFVDASSKAYGSVAYVVNPDNSHNNLLISKARVALCKEDRITIPKLELTAALIGCRLIDLLNSLFSISKFFLWLDSKVALSWINSDKELKDVYIANRVAEIQTLIISLGITVNYVPTNDNPTDLVSRGCTANKLKSSNWMHDPTWLLTQESPKQDNEEVVVVQELTVEINSINPVPPVTDLTRYSKFVKAERVMLKVLQFLKLNLNPFIKLISQEQKLHCNYIYSYLTNPNLEVKNTIRDLNLVLHNDVIRAKGRLENAELPVDAKTPYFLPNRSRLIDFLINHIHESNNHCGVSQTLSLY